MVDRARLESVCTAMYRGFESLSVRHFETANKARMKEAYQQVFSRGASRFTRWVLSPLLLFAAAFFCLPLLMAIDEQRQAGVIVTSLLIVACIAGTLALWGVPFVGRVVTGIIALGYGWYVFDECFAHYDGSLGLGGPRSAASPINSILGFIVIGAPCLFYTLLGRFSWRKEVESEEDFEDEGSDDEDDEVMVGPDSPRERGNG